MADDDDDAQSSSSIPISIPTMVDGLTPMERSTVIRILKDQVVKDFSHYYYVKRKQNHLETTTSMAENYTVVHPRYVFNPSDEPLLEYLYLDYLIRGKDMKDPACSGVMADPDEAKAVIAEGVMEIPKSACSTYPTLQGCGERSSRSLTGEEQRFCSRRPSGVARRTSSYGSPWLDSKSMRRQNGCSTMQEKSSWTTAAKMEEANGNAATARKIMERGIRALGIDQEEWLKQAEAAERAWSVATCNAITNNTRVPEEERQMNTWVAEEVVPPPGAELIPNLTKTSCSPGQWVITFKQPKLKLFPTSICFEMRETKMNEIVSIRGLRLQVKKFIYLLLPFAFSSIQVEFRGIHDGLKFWCLIRKLNSEGSMTLMPVIPIVLINGAMGGRKYDPWDVIDYFRQRLLKKKKDKEEPVPVQLRLWEKTETSSPPPPPDDDHQARAQTTDLVTTTLLLDKEGGKKKYTLEELLEEFFTLRLKSYEERMATMHEVIESAVDELAEETCKHGGECFDSENMVFGNSLKQEVLYAETKNQILRSTGWPIYDIEVGSNHQSTEWWSEILRVFDILEDDISPKRLWWNDLDALEEQLDIQYKKLEPSKVRLSSAQKWLAYVKNKDEPKTGLKRIWVSDSDSESDSESVEEDSGHDEEKFFLQPFKVSLLAPINPRGTTNGLELSHVNLPWTQGLRQHLDLKLEAGGELVSMADDDDVAQSSSSIPISIPTMVDGLTPMERRTVIPLAEGRIQKARKLINRGCKDFPKNEDVWIEACRLADPDEAKAVIAEGVMEIPKSVKLWLQAAQLERNDTMKSRVLKEGLQYIPDSSRLWRAVVEVANRRGAKEEWLKQAEAAERAWSVATCNAITNNTRVPEEERQMNTWVAEEVVPPPCAELISELNEDIVFTWSMGDYIQAAEVEIVPHIDMFRDEGDEDE
ncbi:hypothetical protein OSB04_018498 [Centaurea solstitialis]|uniref:Uncharacterized protein n=1 Tax=Centaurea solstitialis TaxID=347529 RepID=A0AA38TPW1_9ASTR|nr:hypothetical protein OSB04_018498 [Centaurea solstitialis]